MSPETSLGKKIEFHPVTPERWSDFENLFGQRGACGGCWCMHPRLAPAEFKAGKGVENKKAMKKIVRSGEVPGIIGYIDGKSAAWCAIGPRERYSILERSRILKPVDDNPVWSIVCLFVLKPYRKKGMSAITLKAAADYALKNGADIIEGYPYEPGKILPDPFVYTGLTSAYIKAGFKEVLRRSQSRPIMRFTKFKQ